MTFSRGVLISTALAILGPCLSLSAASAPATPKKSAEVLVRDIQTAVDHHDHLLARVHAKSLVSQPMTFKQWWNLRQLLHENPQLGFDIVAKWDQIRPSTEPIGTLEAKVNALIATADSYQMANRFDDAFKNYQMIAKMVKKEIHRGARAPRFFYWTVVHSMARSLYGAGRFAESLEIYDWIPPDYYKFRQVLFEKMWAAFRAKRYDVALGAIASQQSSYFGAYLEPETYLVQLYLFKKLCRMDEHAKTLTNVERIVKKVDGKNASYSWEEWAQSDVETKVLYNLAKIDISSDENQTAKKQEQAVILTALKTRFENERRRLQTQFNTVLAYSRLSVALDKEIVVTDVVPDRDALMKSRREFWPVEDAEDWIDELGQHLYIGESQCGKKATP